VSGLSLLGALEDLGRWKGGKGKVRKCFAGRGSLGVGLPKHPYYRDDERVEDVFSSPTWKAGLAPPLTKRRLLSLASSSNRRSGWGGSGLLEHGLFLHTQHLVR
jgi:hypothetical protein